jgi:molecular chaperone GrpE (heat shock protein)
VCSFKDFVDDLLDVADTLERAVQSVPEEVVKEGRDPETREPISAERVLSILCSFVEGIKLTYNTLDKVPVAHHGQLLAFALFS